MDPIWLDNSVCNGDESSLLECNTNPIGQHSCNHSEDAGVKCNGIVVVNVLNLTLMTTFTFKLFDICMALSAHRFVC